MAGSLIKIDEEIVTSAVASVTLTGIDSTYDVYMLQIKALTPDADTGLRLRFTASGTPDTSSNYDRAARDLRSDANFANIAATNETEVVLDAVGTDTNEMSNGTYYLFNFNNASEYSFITYENTNIHSVGALRGRQGGAVLTVAQANDGIQVYFSTANIESGIVSLYGLKK